MTKVLVVEEEPLNMELVLKILDGKGFIAEGTKDGTDAIEMTEKELYDLILMDMKMPAMDGLEVTKAIKSKRAYKDVPVIALIAYAMMGDKERILSEGYFNDCISKPIDIINFIKIMEKYRR